MNETIKTEAKKYFRDALGRFKEKIAAQAENRILTKITAAELVKKFYSSYGSSQKIAVRLVDKEIPEMMRGGMVYRPKYTFKDNDLFITNMYGYGKDNIYTNIFYISGEESAVTLRDDFAFFLLENEESAKITKTWADFQIKNLQRNLQHAGDVSVSAEYFVLDKDGKCLPADLFHKRNATHASYNSTTSESIGYAARFRTCQSTCFADCVDGVSYGLRDTYDSFRKKYPEAKLALVSTASVPLDKDMVEAKTNPVLNAYGLKPSVSEDPSIRSARASVHFAFNFTDDEDAIKSVVKTLDATVGVVSVSLLAKINNPKLSKYVLPGDYRLNGRELEYCALGNEWLSHPFIANLLFDFARKAVVLGQKGLGSAWKASEEEVLSCMMNLDVNLSHKIMDRNKDIMMKLFQAAWPICVNGSAAGVPHINDVKPEKAKELLYNVFYNGYETIVKDVHNIPENWTLTGVWVTHSEGDGKNVWRTVNSILGKKKFPNHVIYG